MKNKIKYIVFIIILFLVGCDKCGLSDMCHYNKDQERIAKMTEEQKLHEKQKCIEIYQHMIDVTENEEKVCNFWKCVNGKNDWKKSLEYCLRRFDNNR